jgi:hypothetical protein
MMLMRKTDVLADKPSQSHPVRHKILHVLTWDRRPG